MLRILLPLALAAIALLVAACNSSEEIDDMAVSPSPSPTATASPADGDVVFCHQIAIAGEATPSTPTPVPSCDPTGGFTEVGPGIEGRIGDAPPLPSGTAALTNYAEFQLDNPATGANISLPLNAAAPIGGLFAWYTYEGGAWERLAVTPQIHESNVSEQDGFASGSSPLCPTI